MTPLFFHTVTNQMLLLRKVLQPRCKRSCSRSEEIQQCPYLQLLSCVCKTHARLALIKKKKRGFQKSCVSFSFDSIYCPRQIKLMKLQWRWRPSGTVEICLCARWWLWCMLRRKSHTQVTQQTFTTLVHYPLPVPCPTYINYFVFFSR